MLVKWLADTLRESGHSVEVLEFPFDPDHRHLLPQLLALRLVDLTQQGDRLITLRPPIAGLLCFFAFLCVDAPRQRPSGDASGLAAILIACDKEHLYFCVAPGCVVLHYVAPGWSEKANGSGGAVVILVAELEFSKIRRARRQNAIGECERPLLFEVRIARQRGRFGSRIVLSVCFQRGWGIWDT